MNIVKSGYFTARNSDEAEKMLDDMRKNQEINNEKQLLRCLIDALGYEIIEEKEENPKFVTINIQSMGQLGGGLAPKIVYSLKRK